MTGRSAPSATASAERGIGARSCIASVRQLLTALASALKLAGGTAPGSAVATTSRDGACGRPASICTAPAAIDNRAKVTDNTDRTSLERRAQRQRRRRLPVHSFPILGAKSLHCRGFL